MGSPRHTGHPLLAPGHGLTTRSSHPDLWPRCCTCERCACTTQEPVSLPKPHDDSTDTVNLRTTPLPSPLLSPPTVPSPLPPVCPAPAPARPLHHPVTFALFGLVRLTTKSGFHQAEALAVLESRKLRPTSSGRSRSQSGSSSYLQQSTYARRRPSSVAASTPRGHPPGRPLPLPGQ